MQQSYVTKLLQALSISFDHVVIFIQNYNIILKHGLFMGNTKTTTKTFKDWMSCHSIAPHKFLLHLQKYWFSPVVKAAKHMKAKMKWDGVFNHLTNYNGWWKNKAAAIQL